MRVPVMKSVMSNYPVGQKLQTNMDTQKKTSSSASLWGCLVVGKEQMHLRHQLMRSVDPKPDPNPNPNPPGASPGEQSTTDCSSMQEDGEKVEWSPGHNAAWIGGQI